MVLPQLDHNQDANKWEIENGHQLQLGELEAWPSCN